MAYSNFIDALEPQPFLPDRYRDPERALVILEPVPSQPRGALRKLNLIQDHEYVRKVGLMKEASMRRKIRTVGTQNSSFCSAHSSSSIGTGPMIFLELYSPKSASASRSINLQGHENLSFPAARGGLL